MPEPTELHRQVAKEIAAALDPTLGCQGCDSVGSYVEQIAGMLAVAFDAEHICHCEKCWLEANPDV